MTVDKLSHESYSALEPQQNLNLAGPIGERARLLPLCLRALGTLRCTAHETDRESLILVRSFQSIGVCAETDSV